MARLAGKKALVTGAAQGIGAATARLLAREGAQAVAGLIAAHTIWPTIMRRRLRSGCSADRSRSTARNGWDIRCNSIHPTFIRTPILDDMIGDRDEAATMAKLARQVPLGRLGDPEEVAHAVVYLASDESRFMTGAELKLDGGISAM